MGCPGPVLCGRGFIPLGEVTDSTLSKEQRHGGKRIISVSVWAFLQIFEEPLVFHEQVQLPREVSNLSGKLECLFQHSESTSLAAAVQ